MRGERTDDKNEKVERGGVKLEENSGDDARIDGDKNIGAEGDGDVKMDDGNFQTTDGEEDGQQTSQMHVEEGHDSAQGPLEASEYTGEGDKQLVNRHEVLQTMPTAMNVDSVDGANIGGRKEYEGNDITCFIIGIYVVQKLDSD